MDSKGQSGSLKNISVSSNCFEAIIEYLELFGKLFSATLPLSFSLEPCVLFISS